jgi:DNA-binding NtrC family response regulator
MSEQNKPSLLIVDDDPIITDTLSYALSEDFEVTTSESRQDAIATVRAGSLAPQLALIDLGLPPLPHDPGEGFALIGELMAHSPAIKIIVLSGQGEAEHARHARSLGAVEFVPKPCDPDVLREVLWQTLKFRAVELSSNEGPAAPELIGTSPPITRLRSQVQQYADFPFPALIEGESGSGKELVAQLLHRLSSRRGKPMLALNCAAISPTLVEPTLFGYVKGAFTGAGSNKSGYFEDAADGTLFLDEIGELPLELQAKLLHLDQPWLAPASAQVALYMEYRLVERPTGKLSSRNRAARLHAGGSPARPPW